MYPLAVFSWLFLGRWWLKILYPFWGNSAEQFFHLEIDFCFYFALFFTNFDFSLWIFYFKIVRKFVETFATLNHSWLARIDGGNFNNFSLLLPTQNYGRFTFRLAFNDSEHDTFHCKSFPLKINPHSASTLSRQSHEHSIIRFPTL